MIGFLLYMLVIGLVAGFVARALLPGNDAMSIAGTIVLGIIGSFVGGFLGWAIFGHDLDDGALQPANVLGSIVGAIIVLMIYRMVNGRRALHR